MISGEFFELHYLVVCYNFATNKKKMIKHLMIGLGVIFSCITNAQISIHSKFSGVAKAGNKGELEVEIQKKSINSFAKYQVEFPNGVSIAEVNSKNGNFSIEGDKAKIVWINLPNEEKFNIKLSVMFKENVQFPITLYQKFYYLENSVKKEVSADPLVINASESLAIEVNKDNSASNQNIQISLNTFDKTSNNKETYSTSSKDDKKENKNATEIKPVEKKIEEKTHSNVSNISSEFTYRVQIAASPVKPSENAYSNAGAVEIVFHNGMYKVISKKEFASKEEALQYREQLIQKGYTGAFLVKYQNGKRVN